MSNLSNSRQIRLLPLALASAAILGGILVAESLRTLNRLSPPPREQAADLADSGVETGNLVTTAPRGPERSPESQEFAWSECATVDEYRGPATSDWHGDFPVTFDFSSYRLLRMLWVDRDGMVSYRDVSGQTPETEKPKLGFPVKGDCDAPAPKELVEELRTALVAVGRCDDTWPPPDTEADPQHGGTPYWARWRFTACVQLPEKKACRVVFDRHSGFSSPKPLRVLRAAVALAKATCSKP